jgi:hypothetical protein
MVSKILENFSSVFYIFDHFYIHTVIDTKIRYGVTGIGRNMVGLSYRLFFDWPRKSDIFLDLF